VEFLEKGEAAGFLRLELPHRSGFSTLYPPGKSV